MTGGATLYIGPANADAAMARAQAIAPVDMEIDNLICLLSVVPGGSETLDATVLTGTCTSALAASTDQVVQASASSRVSNQATTAEAVTGGDCYVIELEKSASAAATRSRTALPSSVWAICRPRNIIVTFTLFPSPRNSRAWRVLNSKS